MNLSLLKEPFPASDIEWRVGQAGKNDKGVWAKVLAYITNRAIMERLDAVCGPENWKNEYQKGPEGGVLCGISIRCGDEWVTKWDGADNTDVESVKGGLSSAMKRAAVQWGIGRYLYDLEEGWATVSANGKYYVPMNEKKSLPAFKWDPPALPAWALPHVAKQSPVVTKEESNKADVSAGMRIAALAKDLGMDVNRDIYGPMKIERPTKQQAKVIIEGLEEKKKKLSKELDAKAVKESNATSKFPTTPVNPADLPF